MCNSKVAGVLDPAGIMRKTTPTGKYLDKKIKKKEAKKKAKKAKSAAPAGAAPSVNSGGSSALTE